MQLPLGTELLIARDDLNHPLVSGNKLHKLKPSLDAAKNLNCDTLLSFGGPYSNHLHAMAWACKENDLNSIGVIRGELNPQLTPTLRDCQHWGMQLTPMCRKDFRRCAEALNQAPQPCRSHHILASYLPKLTENTLLVPEGGSNQAAIDALAAAYAPMFKQPQYRHITHVACATGTGATVAGLCKAAPSSVKVLGVQAVAEGDATLKRIVHWLGQTPSNLELIAGHLGGFAKAPKALTDFIDEFERSHDVPLDLVYNGKVIYQLHQLARDNFFAPNSTVLAIHTGGLQGKRGKSA